MKLTSTDIDIFRSRRFFAAVICMLVLLPILSSAQCPVIQQLRGNLPNAESDYQAGVTEPAQAEPAAEQALPTSTRPPADVARESWRKTMLQTPRPKKGCFVVTYPETQWAEVQCTTAPQVPYPPRKGAWPQTVGRNTDFSAQVAGNTSGAEGSFDSVTGVTNETGAGRTNSYSLQLNTNFIKTEACSSAVSPTYCRGWEQFIFSSTCSEVFIQYWLLSYSMFCPKGWQSDENDDGGCWVNSQGVLVPTQTITTLGELALTGVAGSAQSDDSVTLSISSPGGLSLYSVTGDNHFPDLTNGLQGSDGWQVSEFNVFGDAGGTQAVFNTGSTIVVRTAVDSGTTSAPTCDEVSFTAETNNLTLVDMTPPVAGAEWPSLVFKESNAAGSTPVSCSGAISVPAVTVGVSPASVVLSAGGSQQFAATVSGGVSQTVTWTASAGTISQSGLYTAPASITTQQTVTVTACTEAAPPSCGSATVTLLAPPVISPSSAALYAGGTQAFTTSVPGGGSPPIGSWTLNPNVGTLGGIPPNGQIATYYAPSSITTQQTVTVTACLAAYPNLCGTATVTLLAPPVISPSSASLTAGGTQAFTTSVPGGGSPPIGSWTLNPNVGTLGGIPPNGQIATYYVPSSITTQQTVTVTACLAAYPNLCGSATVTLLPPPPPTCSLTVSPSLVSKGGSATLTWRTTNATSASINNGIGAVSPVSSGSKGISNAQATTTYTMTASNSGGNANCSATLTVCKSPLLPNGQCP